MNARPTMLRQKTTPPAFMPMQGGVLQRKCAYGESAGLTGGREEFGEKRLSLRRRSLQSELNFRTRAPARVGNIL